MQRNKNVSLKHFQELEQSERMANDIATPVVKGTHDRGDHESKVYTQLRPLLVLMKLFGLYYKRESDKFGKVRTEKCVYYCVFLCFLMIVNVIRSFSVYRIGDAFNHALVQKVIFTIWSSECTMKSIILLRACYSQKGLPYFFKEWKYVSEDASLDKWGLLVMKKYIVLTFLFLTVNSVAFLLILQYVPILNEIYLEVVWRDALQFASAAVFNAVFGLLAVLNSTSSMFPVSLFVVLSCAVGKQLGDFNNELQLLTDDEEFHGKFEEFRLRHQHLSGLVDMLDRIFSPMLAAVYCANIPMFCLVLYTMISSTDIHISLVLLNFCWLCFILFQLSVVSYTAAWVNCKVSFKNRKFRPLNEDADIIVLVAHDLFRSLLSL